MTLSLTTRAGKGSALTHTEMDTNFADIQTEVNGILDGIADNVFNIHDNTDTTKIGAFDASSISTATTRTYTLPDKNGTIALLSDVGSGGTFDDDAFTLQDDSDNTKKAVFQVSNISTSTTRTYTFPDASGTFQLTLSEGAFADGDKTKLDGIETSADVTDATNVAAAGAVMADGSVNITGDMVFAEKADHGSTPSAGFGYLWVKNTAPTTLIFTDDAGTDTTLGSGGGGGGTVDTSGTPVANDFARFTDADTIEGRSYAEVRSDLSLEVGTDVQAHSAVLDATTASFTTADETKLDGIEASADVTDTTNVTAAGALMDSELTSIADVKALDQSVISGASPVFSTANMTDAADKRFMTDAQETKLDGIESGADVTDATNVNAAGATMNTDTNVFSNSWVLDEDTMSSNSNTKVPTQQSVKAYVDANAGGGGTELISHTVISNSAEYEFLSFDSSSYAGYIILLGGIYPATDNQQLGMQLDNNDDGSSYYTAGYEFAMMYNLSSSSTPTGNSDTSHSEWTLTPTGVGDAGGESGVFGQLVLMEPDSSYVQMESSLTYMNNAGGLVNVSGGYIIGAAAPINAFKLYFASGNIQSGEVTVLGVKNS